MKTSHVLLLVAAGFVAGMQFNRGVPVAIAQSETPSKPVERYQITSYGMPGERGCYILDTATGELWFKQNDQPIRHAADARLK